MPTVEAGAIIVALRSESAQFRAEMDKARGSLKDVATHSALSTRQLARFGAIAAEQVVPQLQGSRVAIEGLVQAAASSTGAFRLAALAGAGFAAAIGGFALGNFIRNFIDARNANLGYVESLKIAVGITKDYDTQIKDATESQKKFSAEQQKSREILQGLQRELATARGDTETLLKLDAEKRRAQVQQLPQGERQRAQAIADEAALAQQRAKALEREDAILKTMKEQNEEREKERTAGGEAATALGLSPSGLILGIKEVDKFKADVSALGLEIRNLARDGVPARDIFAQIQAAQGKVDERIAALKIQFAEVPEVFNRLVDIERQIGQGGLTKSLDATVSSIQKLGQGSAKAEDEFGNLVDVTLVKARDNFGAAGENANFLAGIMFQDVPQAASAANQSVVVVTGNVRALAEAFAFASREALFFETVVGSGGNVAVAAPGNF